MAITLNPNAIYNPPSVTPTPTPSDIGLGNVDNTSDLNKPVSLATQNALNSKADLLNGKVKTEQLQGCDFTYDSTNAIITLVDPVGQSFEIDLPIENLFQAANYDETTKTLKLNTVGGGEVDISLADLVDLPEITLATTNPSVVPTTGKKVYFNTTTGKVWFNVNNAWTGGFNTITDSEKAGYGTAFDHSQITGNPHSTTKADIGLGNVDNTADVNKNVATAVKLKTAVKINNVDFDGSGSITIADSTKLPLAGGALTGQLTSNSYAGFRTVGTSGLSSYVPTNQGGYLNWNTNNGQGRLDLICHKGGGIGGIEFWLSDGTTNTSLAMIDVNGNYTKNAATATKLATSRTFTYTGDATGSGAFDGSAAPSIALTLAASGATAGNYGSSAVTAGTAPTFPYLTVNAKGLVTAVSSVTLGSAASYSVGTSGATVPLLNANNTWSGLNSFTSTLRTNQYMDIGYGNTLAGNRVLSFYAAGDSATISGQISVVNTNMTLSAAGGVYVSNTLSVTNALSAASLTLTTALPITSGGTGAKTAADARIALGIQDTVLSSFTATTGTVSTTDTIVTAVSKINGNLGTVDTALTEILGG